jgi:chromosomal replication initiator protein
MNSWNYEFFWKEAINHIKNSISKEEFYMWFTNLNYLSSEKETIILSVPSIFYMDQIKQRYLQIILEILENISGIKLGISFKVIKSTQNQVKKTVENDKKDYIKKRHPDLKENYTFENFIIGENNSFAASAAIAIANNPGKTYNPFLIYGGVGLGKTHLLEAVGHAVFEKFEGKKKICFIPADSFANEFVNSLQKNKALDFENKYRSLDVLLIDDIHFFQNKEGFQEVFFHIFDSLHRSQKQIMFTCDRPISELKSITERMKSRFGMGLNVELNIPNFETRLAILKNKIISLNLKINDDVLEFIAQNITSNIRDMESALIKLIAYSDLINKEVTKEIAQQQLIDAFSVSQQENISIDIIQKKVAEYFNVSPVDIRGRKRTKNIALPRQIAMYIARKITDYSTTEIGIEIGSRDHTTVMHAVQKIEESLKINPTMESTIKNIIKTIKGENIK